MAVLDDLLQKISDPILRDRLSKEIHKATKHRKFGLVFEEHLPECTPLYDLPIKKGARVAVRDTEIKETFTVLGAKDGKALCVSNNDKTSKEFDVNDLMVVAEFGEPIYPYLQYVDSVCNAPDSDLWHTLIEADNYHALQLLEYMYAGKVDCIYIDPPYNKEDSKDWKYNCNYVDGNDMYRHSKWLSMIEKRLVIARKLLKRDGVMIVAIDDLELAHVSLLLEKVFSGYDINTVVVNHHPQGGAADNISRTHEYALFVTPKGQKLIHGEKTEDVEESWSLMRGGTDIRNHRNGRPNSFYAIYVEKSSLRVVGVGPHLDADTPYDINEAPEGCVACYPIGKDGTERVWRYERQSMLQHIDDGEIICTNHMTLKVIKQRIVKYAPVFSVWTDGRYNAGTHGTNMLSSIFCGQNDFPYPKSLYTVEDCIKYATQEKPKALVIDFFAGSGTTLHAVNHLNDVEHTHRRCILVTNNEIGEKKEKALRKDGYRPGDSEWEAIGIAKYTTWPRTVCSIEGHDINGKPLKGTYLGTDVPMSDGFKANAIYFKLGFLDKNAVALGRQFKELLGVLWMKAGAIGSCPRLAKNATVPEMMVLPENRMAILIDETAYVSFVAEMQNHPEIETVYIVTDSDRGYREMAAGLNVRNSYQLYRDYLDNFRINHRR